MLDQLRTFTGLAKAIQADLQQIGVTKPQARLRVKPRKSYMFRPSMYALHPAILRVVKPNGGEAAHYLTNSTYNRFAELANSGSYSVSIEPADYGVAWTMRRPF